nr:hypothetical protein [uncultured Celeribacter sp.]
MTDKPILFSGPMVHALLEGRKTQTRRELKIRGRKGFFQFGRSDTKGYDWTFCRADHVWEDYEHEHLLQLLPYQIGDRLYVRENHFAFGYWITTDELTKTGNPKRKFVRDYDVPVLYENPACKLGDRSVDDVKGWYFRPGIHHERCDSRLTLTVTDVRAQRLQEIREADALAEGVTAYAEGFAVEGLFWGPTATKSFEYLWDSLNAKRGFGWDENPWVAAYTFTVHKCNIDQMGGAA